MRSKNRSIRFKVFMLLLLPLLSLSALWGFVLNLTVGDGLALLRANTLYNTIGVTSTELGVQIMSERALSASLVSSGRRASAELTAQRGRTDAALAEFTKAANSEEATGAMSPALAAPVTSMLRELDRLDQIRAAVDNGTSDRLEVVQAYSRIMDSLNGVYDQLVTVPDLTVFRQAATLQSMANARELQSRQMALIEGALIEGRITPEERAEVARLAATRRHLYDRFAPILLPELRRPYEQVFESTAYRRYEELEDRIVNASGMGDGLPAAGEWKSTANQVAAALDRVNIGSGEIMAEKAKEAATTILLRIAIAGGVGLLAVVASITFSVRFARRHVRDLATLRNSALELADRRLPRVVERLSRGEDVDVAAEAPPIQAGDSREVADVSHAFSSVQRTAVEAAVGQAKLRKGIAQMFVNLARRKQALLNRQLQLLDSMQRRTTEPDALEDLFRLDSLTTRMRRHAESLIILSGNTPGRAWRRPVPIVDVIRAAVAEIEDYQRIQVFPVGETAVNGSVAADLIHLVAELVDNAASFSPPQTTVQIRGEEVANGFVIEIEDRGLGLSAEEYAAINQNLANPPEFDLADSDRLGLFVVGQLANRYGVNVTLRPSPYGGTTAIVLIPRSLLAADEGPAAIEGRAAATATPYVPRHSAPAKPVTATVVERTNGRDDAGEAPDRDRAEGGRAQRDEGEAERKRTTDTSPFFTPAALRTEPVPSALRNLDEEDGKASGRKPGDRRARPDLTVVPGGPQRADAPAQRPQADSAGSGQDGRPDPAEESDRPSAQTLRRPPQPVTNGTYRGLPRRVRQASLAPQLRNRTTPLSAPPPERVPERSPDEARALFSAFQQGARKGRLDSERTRDEQEPNHDVANQITAEKGTE